MPKATLFCEVDEPSLGCKKDEATAFLVVSATDNRSAFALTWVTRLGLVNLGPTMNLLLPDSVFSEELE